MTNVGILGTNGTVSGAAFMPTEQLVRAVGQNTGNLVFQYAAHRLIKSRTVTVGPSSFGTPELLKNEIDALAIPSANFLREDLDMTRFATFLERADLPLVFLGLGAQAASMSTTRLNLHPSIERLIALVKERSRKVAVRGEFTASILERLGVDGVHITGCPSNFINPDPDFAHRIKVKAVESGSSFITHAEEPWPSDDKKTRVERRLMNWTLTGRAIMVQQSVPQVIEYMRRRNPAAVQMPSEGFEAKLHNQLAPDLDRMTFADFVTHRLRNYVSVEQWMEDSARFDFSIGMRLHGNMAAWQAGTPALWIHHDARTQELVETMALPGLSVDDFLTRCSTLEDARKLWAFDANQYTKRRAALRDEFNSVLTAHDIEPAQ